MPHAPLADAGDAARPASAQPATPRSLQGSVEAHLRDYFRAHEGDLPAPGLYGRFLTIVEKPLIALTLRATGGNQLRAAELLGINRNTLRKKIGELGIEIDGAPDGA